MAASKTKLALLGGKPVLAKPLLPYKSMGREEAVAVAEVMRSGRISAFYGSWGDDYFGGKKVRGFEAAWAEKFHTKHAVSVNSATSGLMAAMGAAGVEPGDEVIVPPYTMSATAMAPLVYGGVPVFADIEAETFCLDLDSVRRAITPRTRVILAVNLFGHPARLAELRTLADERGIVLVEDNAQSPLASEGEKFAGTIGHIGVFSLNFHKHIHTGEGGICVTDNDELALKLKMIRNHAENAVEHTGVSPVNMVGFNFRLTELGAAIGLAQLAKSDEAVASRRHAADYLTQAAKDLSGLKTPLVRKGCSHVYYVWALRFDKEKIGVSRQVFAAALTAEGFPVFEAYVRPLYMLPAFQQRVALGRGGFPFSLRPEVPYNKGLCPVCEKMHYEEFLGFETCAYALDERKLEQLSRALLKVYENRAQLQGWGM
ncbi:MAG: hypothetical protein A2X49_03525 [Lentisphaerae bacterium GWF2_52_8]|nr:MAG: hypothetical protein A2X49_03525 [Lentisphaerae bacterium GWF2_52_8]